MSTLKADTIQNTSGGAATLTKQSAAKAFLLHQQNSTGSAVLATDTTGDSLNISSVTDLETGGIKPALTSAMSSTEYAPVCSGHYNGTLAQDDASRFSGPSALAASNYRCFAQYSNGNPEDSYYQNAVFGDLA